MSRPNFSPGAKKRHIVKDAYNSSFRAASDSGGTGESDDDLRASPGNFGKI